MASSGAFLDLLACTLVVMAPALALADQEDWLCPSWQRTSITHALFFSNGSVEDVVAGELYPPGMHWAETVDGTPRLLGCPCLLGRPCLRKCCAWDQQMDYETEDCVARGGPPSRDWFRPRVMGEIDGELREIERGQFGIANGKYCIGSLLNPKINSRDEFYINSSDGTLNRPLTEDFGLDTSSFCLEYVNEVDLYLPYVCSIHLKLTIEDYDEEILLNNFYPVGMAISIVLLVISLVIYSTTAELRNLHGKCSMCYMASLIVGYIFRVIVNSGGILFERSTCTAFGFVAYFALLSSFFWLNIMCIDICYNFSSLNPPRMNSSDLIKFLKYILYAWGLPFFIIIVTAVMEFHPELASDIYLRPEFEYTCWFLNDLNELVYLDFPVGCIVVCNVIVLAMTAFNIYRANRETLILQRGSSSRSSEEKNRMKMNIKLSIVMGVSCILEIVSKFEEWDFECRYFLFAMNLIYPFQGLFIFLIFVCNRNMKEIMRNRFRKMTAKVSTTFARDSGELGRCGPEANNGETSRNVDTASTSFPSMEMAEKYRP